MIPSIRSLHFLHGLKLAAIVLAILFGGVLLVLAIKWPFTREAVIRSLEQVSSSDVQLAYFQKRFFPHPGYVAENVTFTREGGAGGRPIATIRKITCRATWLMMITFTHRIGHMDLEEVRVYIPAHFPPPRRKHPGAKIETTVTELSAKATVLEIAPRHAGAQTLLFGFPELILKNLARDKAMTFRALVRNPSPVGDLKVSGTFGPLMPGNVGETRISGTYQFRHADLGQYKVIAGTLSADGRFNGKLRQAEVVGRTEIPDFEVTRSRHALGLTAEYHAKVDGMHGDVFISSAEAHFLGTTLKAQGSVSGEPGKTVSLDFDADEARVQDLLRLFVTADRPPLDGAMVLHAHVVVPPAKVPFLERVQLQGHFSIKDAEFTKPATQEKVNELSARADPKEKRKPPERVASELAGDVTLRQAVATFKEAEFAVPGANVHGAGTYNVETEAVDLQGKLAMRASLSQAAGGLKSILLKPVDPLYKKDGAGAVVRVRMTGTYSHPVFKVSLRP